MRHLPLVAVAALVASMAPVALSVSDSEVAARRAALEVAGAFSNDGFKIRDGAWIGEIASGKSSIIQVNLYAGNEYWFSLGTAPAAKKASVTIYDETGTPMEYEPYTEGGTAAAGFSPEASGPYYVKVELLEGEQASFCLVYSYQ